MKSKFRIKNKPTKAISRLTKLSNRFKGPNTVKVGLPKGSNNYPDGTSLIMVGTVHEFGSPINNIPQRSYLRSTVSGNRARYKTMHKKIANKIVEGEMDMTKGLKVIGLKVESDVKSKIRSISTPPLKHRKGNPLIRTGHLIQSITHVVE